MTITRRILILCIACALLPLSAQQNPAPLRDAADAGTEVLDSQQFLLRNRQSRGAAKDYSAAVEKLLSQMTLKEKVGQMTQLDIMMVTDGHNQEIKINPEKLKKAVGEYG